RHEVGDAGSVLRNADPVPARGARVAVRHVDGALLVSDRHEADTGGGEDIEGVHERRADDSEDMGDAVGGKCLDERLGRSHLLRLGHLAWLRSRSFLQVKWFVSLSPRILQYRRFPANLISMSTRFRLV